MSSEKLAHQATIAEESQQSDEKKSFVDRRTNPGNAPGVERRQFTNSYGELSTETQELANAIDQYKLRHRRRFITYDEMLAVIKSLGYHK